MKRARQTSESIELAAILAFSGGLMDAYSYLARGKVFANAQTGNILLFGVNLADGDAARALHYAVPVIAFAAGIALAHSIKIFSREHRLHWRQIALLVEAALLVIVSCTPDDLNLIANSLTSLGCGIQVQAFRKLHGNGFATTMCIGNLRSGTQRLVDYVHERDRAHLEGCLLYYGVILCFAIGAITGSRVIGALGLRAILVSSALLLVAFFVMFQDREKGARERAAAPDTAAASASPSPGAEVSPGADARILHHRRRAIPILALAPWPQAVPPPPRIAPSPFGVD
ncbi:MAG: YoaK family protein [Tractidigestivibacter sp.]|uniref:YoaK family protein n=1 Tax=Tractidigestivibacter sp. TaxID=2847320 RepID=UPI002A827DFE|nr:YoaK family protein [Tractidigestivibacter sp.]MDY4535174.1 YoaK family protein [Tractidigestivibacter sp.]